MMRSANSEARETCEVRSIKERLHDALSLSSLPSCDSFFIERKAFFSIGSGFVCIDDTLDWVAVCRVRYKS
jgi:hypothetical protein